MNIHQTQVTSTSLVRFLFVASWNIGPLYSDVKMENLLVDELNASGMAREDIIVQSFSPDSLKDVKRLADDLKLVILTKIALTTDDLDKLAEAGVYGIGAEKNLVITSENNRRTGYTDLVAKSHRL